MNKRFISAAELLLDSFRLAQRVLDSGLRPDLLIGVWRGGTPVAAAVLEYLTFRGVRCEHLPVKTASYSEPGRRGSQVQIDGIETVVRYLRRDTVLLVVDDVFDTGLSMKSLAEQLYAAAPPGAIADLRVACPWFKPSQNVSGLVPDYYLHETDDWLVFPHELVGLGPEELRRKPDLAPVFTEFFGD